MGNYVVKRPDSTGPTPSRQISHARITYGPRSERNAAWISQHIKVPEGKFVGRPVVLSPKQRRWLHRIYDSQTRMFILSMARKNAKTAFCGFLLLLHLCGPEARPNSQLFSAAQSRDQAAILFALSAKMVRMNPDLLSVVTIRDTAKQLECPELGTLYRALSADASTAYGLSPAFTVHDELGQVKGPRSELYDALESASGAQEAPLSIVISTQSPTDADLLSLLIDDALTGADPTIKVELYTCPKETVNPDGSKTQVDPFLESSIRLANPHYDDFMNKDEVLKQAATAKRMPTKESSYRNLILNQRVEAKDPFVTRSVWSANGLPPKSLVGKRVFAGLDLASVSDLAALVLLDEENNVEPTFWLPETGLAEKSREDRVPYDLWNEQGYLKTTPGATISYEFIATYLRGIFDAYNVVLLGFDRYNMKFLTPWLIKAGFSTEELERFVPFGQGFASMSPAIRALEEKLLDNKIRHGNQPVLTMCAANTVVQSDPAGNRKFIKAKASGRIDGMVALVMAVGVMPNEEVSDQEAFEAAMLNPIVVT